MSTANHLHTFKRLVRRLVTTDHSTHLARHVAHRHVIRISLRDDDAIEHVALRKHTEQLAALVHDADSADIPSSHKLRCFLHGRRGPRGIRLTVPDHVPDKHRFRLLLLGSGYYRTSSTDYTDVIYNLCNLWRKVLKQTRLRGGSAESGAGGFLMRAFLVEAETLTVDLEETLGGFPVLTFAAHALAEHARVEFP